MSDFLKNLFDNSVSDHSIGNPGEASGIQEDADNTFIGKHFVGSLVGHSDGTTVLYFYRIYKGKYINLDRNAASYLLDKATEYFQQFPASMDNAYIKRTETGCGAYVLFKSAKEYGYVFKQIVKDFFKTV